MVFCEWLACEGRDVFLRGVGMLGYGWYFVRGACFCLLFSFPLDTCKTSGVVYVCESLRRVTLVFAILPMRVCFTQGCSQTQQNADLIDFPKSSFDFFL